MDQGGDTRDRVIRLEPQVIALNAAVIDIARRLDVGFEHQAMLSAGIDHKVDRVLNRAWGALWFAGAMGFVSGIGGSILTAWGDILHRR